MRYKSNTSEWIGNLTIKLILISICCATIYPFLYILSVSVSDPLSVMKGEIFLLPKNIHYDYYRIVFRYPLIGTSYLNTIFYTVVGTIINMILTVITAYPLAKRNLFGRSYFNMFIAFTMLFSGGMIPTFLLVKDLGLLNLRAALIIPGAINAWNLILMRSFFENVPSELEEAASIDGSSILRTLFMIIIPVSIPAVATIGLFYAVAHWNDFMDALIYLRDSDKMPAQMILRLIVLQSSVGDMMNKSSDELTMAEGVKAATIMVVSVPIIVLYPFVQNYFVKGIMIGSVKE